MKYDRLIEIQKKTRLFGRLVNITFTIAIIIAICSVIVRMNAPSCMGILGGLLAMAVMLTIASIVFIRIQGRYERMAEDYFIIRIMDLINEQGIESDKFELIEERNGYYRVGFHNQNINYLKLQAAIDEEVIEMCRIMKTRILVKLI